MSKPLHANYKNDMFCVKENSSCEYSGVNWMFLVWKVKPETGLTCQYFSGAQEPLQNVSWNTNLAFSNFSCQRTQQNMIREEHLVPQINVWGNFFLENAIIALIYVLLLFSTFKSMQWKTGDCPSIQNMSVVRLAQVQCNHFLLWRSVVYFCGSYCRNGRQDPLFGVPHGAIHIHRTWSGAQTAGKHTRGRNTQCMLKSSCSYSDEVHDPHRAWCPGFSGPILGLTSSQNAGCEIFASCQHLSTTCFLGCFLWAWSVCWAFPVCSVLGNVSTSVARVEDITCVCRSQLAMMYPPRPAHRGCAPAPKLQ